MSSPLMFVRDGRTLPFIPVTLDALRAIRVRCEKVPYALATYLALLELANEGRTDRVAVTQRDLVVRSNVSRSTVQRALVELAAAGLLEVSEQHHANARLENEYVVVEPGVVDDTPASDRGEGRVPQRQGTKEREENETEDARADARQKLPEGFPDDLRPHVVAVYRTLREIAVAHNAKRVWPLALGRVVLANRRKPLVATANELAVWAVDPPRPILDVVATYSTFLKRAGDLEGLEALDGEGNPRGLQRGALRREDPRAARMADADARGDADLAAINRMINGTVTEGEA